MTGVLKTKTFMLSAAFAAFSGALILCATARAESLPQGFLPATSPKEISGRAATTPLPPEDRKTGGDVKGQMPPPPQGLKPAAPDMSSAPPISAPPPPPEARGERIEGRASPADGPISHTPPPELAGSVDHATSDAYGSQVPQKMYANPPADYGSSGPKGTPDQEAFEETLRRMSPMSDDQIRRERSHMDSRDRVMAEPANGVIPTPHSGTISLSLKPGESPPRIGLAPGNATVLTFYDQTGAPWPITSVTSGNADAFSSSKAGQSGKTNMAVIAPKASYGFGNLVVTLEGLPVPVIFSVVCGSGVVDYRKDVRIRGRGPNAHEDITEGSSLQPANDKVMNDFLDDLPPKGAVSIKTSNPDVQAWRYKHLVYVRSHTIMAAPDYVQDAKSPEGGYMYAIDDYTLRGSPVLQFLVDGRSVYVDLDIGDVE